MQLHAPHAMGFLHDAWLDQCGMFTAPTGAMVSVLVIFGHSQFWQLDSSLLSDRQLVQGCYTANAQGLLIGLLVGMYRTVLQ